VENRLKNNNKNGVGRFGKEKCKLTIKD